MENPNNCETCKHKQHPDGGWCYMFRDEPTEVCMIHSGRCTSTFARDLVAQQVPLGHEFASVLSANLWDLYVTDGEVPNACGELGGTD